MTGESLQRQVAGLVRGQRGQAAAFGEVQAMTDDRGLDVQVMLRRVAGEHPVDLAFPGIVEVAALLGEVVVDPVQRVEQAQHLAAGPFAPALFPARLGLGHDHADPGMADGERRLHLVALVRPDEEGGIARQLRQQLVAHLDGVDRRHVAELVTGVQFVDEHLDVRGLLVADRYQPVQRPTAARLARVAVAHRLVRLDAAFEADGQAVAGDAEGVVDGQLERVVAALQDHGVVQHALAVGVGYGRVDAHAAGTHAVLEVEHAGLGAFVPEVEGFSAADADEPPASRPRLATRGIQWGIRCIAMAPVMGEG